jgi:hypothetical protein
MINHWPVQDLARLLANSPLIAGYLRVDLEAAFSLADSLRFII